MPINNIANSRVVPQFTICSHSPRHHEVVESSLERIKSGRNGAALINAICQVMTNGKKLYIDCDNHTNGTFVHGRLTDAQIARYGVSPSAADRQHEHFAHQLSVRKPDNSYGEGVSAMIRFHPDEAVWTDALGVGHSVQDPRLSFVTLAHELVHAFHLLNGTSLASQRDHIWIEGSGQRQEEDRATGVGDFSRTKLSENGIRADHGIPLRASYFLAEHLAPNH